MYKIGLSQLIKPIVLSIDFILLNCLISIFFFFFFFSKGDTGISDIAPIWAILILSFGIVSITYTPILYLRRIKGYQILYDSFLFALKNAVVTCVISFLLNYSLSISLLVIFYICFLIILSVTHLCMWIALKNYRIKGGNSRSCIFIGDSSNLIKLYTEMSNNLTLGYVIKGYFSDSRTNYPDQLPYLGTPNQVTAYLSKNYVEQVYCDLSLGDDTLVSNIINYCENHLIRFYGVPILKGNISKVTFKIIGDLVLISLHKEPLLHLGNIILKRFFDFLFSLLFIVTLFPIIYIVIGIIIKLTSPGPILFKQKRTGQYGKEFWCYKFRSMNVNEQADTLQARFRDPRITKFGRFLRESSLDELPQFINVLRGEMSIVGPRPHMIKHTIEYGELINKYMVRHYVKPGITGWAQVTGFRGETKTLSDMEGRIRQDIWYIEHWSFALDMYIIILTIYNGFKGDKKAY